jgi:hypothetical protein
MADGMLPCDTRGQTLTVNVQNPERNFSVPGDVWSLVLSRFARVYFASSSRTT